MSKKQLNRALWFQELPHYDKDSSAYYYDKAINLLQAISPRPYEQLATIYLHRSNSISCNYNLIGIDSLANIGWSYLKKTS